MSIQLSANIENYPRFVCKYVISNAQTEDKEISQQKLFLQFTKSVTIYFEKHFVLVILKVISPLLPALLGKEKKWLVDTECSYRENLGDGLLLCKIGSNLTVQ